MKNILILAVMALTLLLLYNLVGRVDDFVKSRRRKGNPYPYIPETLSCMLRRIYDKIFRRGRYLL